MSAAGDEGPRSPEDLGIQLATLQRLSRGASPAAALRRRLLHGSGWVLLAMALSSILGRVVNALLARLLTHDEFGAYFLVFSLASFGAQMAVALVNDGPVTLVLSTDDWATRIG